MSAPPLRVGQIWLTPSWRLKNRMRTRLVKVEAITYTRVTLSVQYDSHPGQRIGLGARPIFSVDRVRFVHEYKLFEDTKGRAPQ